jgi:hypothetical protein
VKSLAFLPAAMLVLCLGCDTQQVAGTGSQTGNSVVAGRILPSDSVPVPSNVRVYLRPLSWTSGNPHPDAALDSTFTDSLGFYLFPSVPRDTYRVEARGTRSGWSHTVRAQEEVVQVPAGSLQSWGRLFVEIDVSDTLRGGRVEFYGLDRVVEIPDTLGEIRFMVDSLPVGTQTVRIWLPTLSRMFCEAPVRIGPDSLSTIEYETWDRDGRGPVEDP